MSGRRAKPREQRQSKKEQAKGSAAKQEIQEEAKPRMLLVEMVDLNIEYLKKIWKRSPFRAVLIVLILFLFSTVGYFAAGYYTIHLVPLKNDKINELRFKIQSLETELAPYRALATNKFPGDAKALQKFAEELKAANEKIEKGREKTENIENRLEALEKKERDKLNGEFPIGYKIIGVSSGSIIQGIQKGDFKLAAAWDNFSIKEVQPGILQIAQPMIIFETQGIRTITYDNVYSIPKTVGHRIQLAQSGNYVLYLQIIAIENDLIVMAFGVVDMKKLN